jgi:hypothetical protein
MRLTFQSLANYSQIPKLASPTALGTQLTLAFCATSFSRK